MVKSILVLTVVLSTLAVSQSSYEFHNRFRIFAGLDQPLGDFQGGGSSNPRYFPVGDANAGYCVGGEYMREITRGIQCGLSFAYSSDEVDNSKLRYSGGESSYSFTADSWRLYDFLFMVGAVGTTHENIALFGNIYIGGLYGENPAVTGTTSNGENLGTSERTTALSGELGLGVGVLFGSRFEITLRALGGDPAYAVGAEPYNGIFRFPSFSGDQSTGRLQATVGVDF